MINGEKIDKILKIVNQKTGESVPKYFDIGSYLKNSGFKGDDFLSPEGGYKNGNFIVYNYYNSFLNSEVDLYFHTKSKRINACLTLNDQQIMFPKLSLYKLIKILDVLKE